MSRPTTMAEVEAHNARVATWRGEKPFKPKVDYVPPKPRLRVFAARGMNHLEASFSLLLEARKRAGDIEWWGFEKFRLRLADGTFYKPDFATMCQGRLEFYETKGWFRESARVRLNVAADIFPFPFFLVCKKGKGFTIKQVGLHTSSSEFVNSVFPVEPQGPIPC